jgi:NTP pyrophosphatase (non-canonical NTP hydrolase)
MLPLEVFKLDELTTIAQLKDKIRHFCEERDWDQFHNAKDLAIGMTTESSELLEHFRFKSADQVESMLLDPRKREMISDEMADVLYFIIRFAQVYMIDLSSALEAKLMKNGIKYPVEKAKGSNKKYSEF